MRMLGLYVGSVAALLLGCGTFLVHDRVSYHKSVFDDVALCEARGGEWVNGAVAPLCMTQNEGLLELVDGAFVPFTNIDPWKNQQTSPLAGEALAKEQTDTSTDCVEHVTTPFTGKIASVDFSSWPGAEKYRTAITKDVARGVNFAGSYAVSTWGCGRRKSDACVGHAIVDAKTGEIVLYGAIGIRTASFSLNANKFSLIDKNGDKKVWSIENDEIVVCEE